ncbi:hypothetical protein ACIBEA_40470 [Streptomyces sp. NPDC051555]|uniref:hypothetical protein n=1 Tax=Streptomyces sp. NPDC051555 TaxID=3365657 RepID=UPI0037A63AAF
MTTSEEHTRRIKEERAERERDYAWFHIAADADEFADDDRMWPGRPIADVAPHLDRLFEHAYLSEAHRVSETDLLAALLVLRTLREDLQRAEGHLIETARKKGVTWTRLAPALEVKSRQSAERRYLQLRGDSSDDGRTQEDRVAGERDQRARAKVQRAWMAEHADEIRVLAVRLAAVEDLQQCADHAERTSQERMNRRIFPRPAFQPATWPANLHRAIERDTVPEMFHEIRKATLPAVLDLGPDHAELVAAVAALYRAESEAVHQVLSARWDRRWGPDPDAADEES